jgi:hypothetical protein
MRRRMTMLLALLFVLTSTLLFVPPAHAPEGCGVIGNYFVGYNKGIDQGFASYGTRAYLLVRPSALCPNPPGTLHPENHFADIWVMTASRSGDGWAQAGYEKNAQINMTVPFAQYCRDRDDVGTCRTRFLGNHLLNGQEYRFMVAYNDATSTERMYFGATVMLTTYFNPLAEWLQWPWIDVYKAEAKFRESDIPGDSNQKAVFRDMRYQSNGSGTWTPQPCGMAQSHDTYRWDLDTISCSHRRVWTW